MARRFGVENDAALRGYDLGDVRVFVERFGEALTALDQYREILESFDYQEPSCELEGNCPDGSDPDRAKELLVLRNEISEAELDPEESRELESLDDQLVWDHSQRIAAVSAAFSHKSLTHWWWYLHKGPEIRFLIEEGKEKSRAKSQDLRRYSDYLDALDQHAKRVPEDEYASLLSKWQIDSLLHLRDGIARSGPSPGEKDELGRLDDLLVKHRRLVVENVPHYENKNRCHWWWHLHEGPQVREQPLGDPAKARQEAEKLLIHLTDLWRRMPRIESEFEGWGEFERVRFRTEWWMEDERLERLECYAALDALAGDQPDRHRELKQTIAKNRPIIAKIRDR